MAFSSVGTRVKHLLVGVLSRREAATVASEAARLGTMAREVARPVTDAAAASSGTVVREAARSGSAGDLVLYKEFEEWMILHEKIYDNEAEKQRRFQIYKNTAENRYPLNLFADLTPEERLLYYGHRPPTEEELKAAERYRPHPVWSLYEEFEAWLYEKFYGSEALKERRFEAFKSAVDSLKRNRGHPLTKERLKAAERPGV